MADRNIYDQDRSGSGARIGRGRFVVRVHADKLGQAAPQARGLSPGGKIGLAEVGVSKGGKVTFKAGGADAFAAGRSVGLQTIPVAMTLKSASNAHAHGMLAPAAVSMDQSRSAQHWRSGGLSLTIDLTEMHKVARAAGATAATLERQRSAVSRAINDGMGRYQRALKRRVIAWTGLRHNVKSLQDFKTLWSTPATLTSVLTISSKHTKITVANYNARWNRRMPGVTHSAWNRPQLATGAFLAFKHGIAFKRVAKGPRGLRPLWGPNVAREVDRHHAEAQTLLNSVGASRIGPTAARLLKVAIDKSWR